LYIVGGNDHAGEFANMGGQFFVRFIVHQKFLAPCFAKYTNHFQRFGLQVKMALDAKPARAMQNILAIAAGKIAFGETAIINGIEQVGFAHAIGAANTHDPLGEGKVTRLVIFELGK
jgi:hypothetical protein